MTTEAAPRSTADRPYRITDVTVVDPRDGTHTTHQDVHVADGRITAVTATGAGPGEVVPGEGRYVVPGYVDMHAHPLNQADPRATLELMVAFGVTGFRQMSGGPELLRRRRTGRLDLGERAPRLLATPGSVLTPLNAATERAAVAEVRQQADDGADFIKAAIITPQVYFAVQEQADELGIPVLGHLPAGIDVRAAATAGFRSVEHVGPGVGVLAGCSCAEPQVRADAPPRTIPPADRSTAPSADDVARAFQKLLLNPLQATGPAELDNIRRAVDTYDQDRAEELAEHFAAHETWHCPTLIRIKAQSSCDDPAFDEDPDLEFVTEEQRTAWRRAADDFAGTFDATARATFVAQFGLQQLVVGILADRHVPILVGTDAVGAAWVVPGASLHDEFDLLAGSGLDAARILQAATSEAARFCGREAVAGTVEPGKDADLVLLDADPTAAVANLHTVSGVVVGGLYLSRADLAAITEQAATGGVGS